MAARRKISLVLSDVDGTLVTEDKILTARAQAAVRALGAAGIGFAITSGRPPLGMAMLFDALDITTPIAGFNGGIFVKRDLSILEQRTLSPEISRQAIDMLHQQGLDVWIYRGNDWLVAKADAPHVEREAWTVKFQPQIVKNIDSVVDEVAKIVGVSDDHDRIKRCAVAVGETLGDHATAKLSQPYYLDITHHDANKGAVVKYLSKHLNIPVAEIATIGDQLNDVLMFKQSGLSIAMGNASDEVKAQATQVTDSYNDEGFAKAIERFILGTGE